MPSELILSGMLLVKKLRNLTLKSKVVSECGGLILALWRL